MCESVSERERERDTCRRESVCVCLCVCESLRKKERVGKKWQAGMVRAAAGVKRERERVCVCMCVYA